MLPHAAGERTTTTSHPILLFDIICITPAEVERAFGCFWHETTDSKKEYEGHYHEKTMVEKTVHLYVGN